MNAPFVHNLFLAHFRGHLCCAPATLAGSTLAGSEGAFVRRRAAHADDEHASYAS